MTILVTGGCGYVGSQFCHAAVDAGETVMVIDNLSTGRRHALPMGVPLLVADLADVAAVEAFCREREIETCVHFAAKISAARSKSETLSYYRVNVGGVRDVLAMCSAHSVKRLIFASSASVYGEATLGPVSENHPLSPISPYGRSKAVAEQVIRDVAPSLGLSFAILRYFNVAGADLDGRTGPGQSVHNHLFGVAAQVALGFRKSLPVYGASFPTADGTGVRDYIHVAELACGHLAALSYLRGGGTSRTLNLGCGRGHSVLDVAAAFERAVGHKIATHILPPRDGDPSCVVASCEAAKITLHWEPKADLESMARSTLEWFARGDRAAGVEGAPPFPPKQI